MSIASARAPLALSVGVVCLLLGVSAGVTLMGLFGYHTKPPKSPEGDPPAGGPGLMAGPPGGGMMGGPPGGGMMGGPPGGGMMGGRPGGGGGGGGGFRPNPRNQLASLVVKLDQLTGKPLAVELTDEQRDSLRAQLNGLDTGDELSEEEAQKRLDAILKVLEGQKETFVAAGYRWPGGGGGGGFGGGRPGGGQGNENANPFKEGDNAKHLKSVHDRIK